MMDEHTATYSLAISLRNAMQQLVPHADPDKLYYAIHEALVNNRDQFIEAATLAFVQREIYETLKERFEGDNNG